MRVPPAAGAALSLLLLSAETWLSPLPGTLPGPLQGILPAAQALELRGSTYFTRPPWKVDLVSYFTTVWDRQPEYYFTITLAPDAGASLAQLQIQQIRGADWQFPYRVESTRAFLGRPRREGPPVAVAAVFDQRERKFTIDFPQPVEPGSTVTVAVRPWSNPSVADTYLFQVTALPAGPNPVASPVGLGTLRIYEALLW